MSGDGVVAPDGSPAAEPEQKIEVDANGDPIRQGSLMVERQSYERVIDGLKMISDACAHLIKYEPDNALKWRAHMVMFDNLRKASVHHAGIDTAMKEKETQESRGEPMPWRKCRDRMFDGATQVAGGARQMATCHRGDFWWSGLAETVERYARKLRSYRAAALGHPSLVLPPSFTKH